MRTHRARSYREPLRTEWLTPLLQIFFIFWPHFLPLPSRSPIPRSSNARTSSDIDAAGLEACCAGWPPPPNGCWPILGGFGGCAWPPAIMLEGMPKPPPAAPWDIIGGIIGAEGVAEVVVPMLKSAAVIAPRPQPLTAAESMTTPAPIGAVLLRPPPAVAAAPLIDVAAALIIAATGEAAFAPPASGEISGASNPSCMLTNPWFAAKSSCRTAELPPPPPPPLNRSEVGNIGADCGCTGCTGACCDAVNGSLMSSAGAVAVLVGLTGGDDPLPIRESKSSIRDPVPGGGTPEGCTGVGGIMFGSPPPLSSISVVVYGGGEGAVAGSIPLNPPSRSIGSSRRLLDADDGSTAEANILLAFELRPLGEDRPGEEPSCGLGAHTSRAATGLWSDMMTFCEQVYASD